MAYGDAPPLVPQAQTAYATPDQTSPLVQQLLSQRRGIPSLPSTFGGIPLSSMLQLKNMMNSPPSQQAQNSPLNNFAYGQAGIGTPNQFNQLYPQGSWLSNLFNGGGAAPGTPGGYAGGMPT
jgi:hypothetical protein